MDNDINREINIEQVEFGIDIDNIEYSIEINPRDTFAIELNEQGPQGARGYTGNGISSYELTSTVGLIDTYTITFTDGNTTTVNVTNGRGITSITGPVSVGNVDTYTINYNDSTTSTFTVTNGIDGINPTVTVGTTITGNPGTNASVINTGTAQDIVLDFTIPRGDKGETGEDGNDGFSPIATVSKVGDTATISITDINGTTTATITDGTDGTNGQDGAAATIAVGTVTTGLSTDPASVTNVGTSSAAIFDFTIPKGDKGDTGATGNGIASITKTGTVGLVDTYTILFTDGTSTTFTVTNGQNGSGSVADVLVNGTSVLDGQDAKILIKTINSNSITGSGNLDVGTVTSVNNVSPVSGNVTISIPSDTSDLTNGAGYITSSALSPYVLASSLATVATSGSYSDLSNKPTIPSTASDVGALPDSTKYGADLSYNSNTLQLLDQDGNGLGSSVTIQSSPDIDGKSITTNLSDELQTVGVIDQNNISNAIKTWTGTKAQYDAIVTKDANTRYDITDDITDNNSIVVDLNGKADTDLANCTVPYVASRISNNQGGIIEIWSDGYCVQTGISGAINGTSVYATISLDQSYINTNYACYVTINRKGAASYRDQFLVACNITTTSFDIFSNWAGSGNGTVDNYAQWRTEGYIR